MIPINLGFSAYVGFIHKESVMMRGRTVVKFMWENLTLLYTLNCLSGSAERNALSPPYV